MPRFNLLQNYRTGSVHPMYFTFDILAIRARTLRNCFSRSVVGFCNPSLSAGVMSIWLLDRMIWRSSNGSHESIGSKASLQRQRTGGTNRAGARAAGLSFATTVGRNSESVGTLQLFGTRRSTGGLLQGQGTVFLREPCEAVSLHHCDARCTGSSACRNPFSGAGAWAQGTTKE